MQRQRPSKQFNREFEKKYKSTLEFLRQYIKLKDREKYLNRKIQSTKELMYSYGNGGSEKVDGGLKDERLIGILDKVASIEKELQDLQLRGLEKSFEVERETNKVDYPYSSILRKYYIELKCYEKIAVELNYSYSSIKTLIRVAIFELSKFVPNCP